MSSFLSSSIRDLMLDNGIKNVKELADKIGMRSQTLGLIIRGETVNPREETLQPLADFFNTTVNELLGIDDTFYFPDHLTNIMSYCGLNDYKLSEMSGVNRATISSITSGLSQNPNDATIQKLSSFLGVTVEQMKGLEALDLRELESNISAFKIPLLYKRDVDTFFASELTIKTKDINRNTRSKFNYDNQFCIQSFADISLNDKKSKFKIFFTSNRIHNRQKSIFYKKSEANLFLCKEIIKQDSIFLELESIFSNPIELDDSLMKIGYLVSITSQTADN